MPELPEVETIARSLKKKLCGQKIEQVQVLRKDSIAYPKAGDFARKACGHHVLDVGRRGKYLLIYLDGSAGLCVHLRMSGRLLLLLQSTTVSKHTRVRFLLGNEKELRFEDQRVFGRIWYVPKGKTFNDIVPALKTLGPEPLAEIDAQALFASFRHRSRSIKTALLDQSLLAGIGNIYADESLFLAGIHPSTPCQKLTVKQLDCLLSQVKTVLSKAILLGGSSLRNYTDSEGVNGNYQGTAFVYGRRGSPCPNCQKPIERLRLGGRSAHFCPRCQKLPGPKKRGIPAKPSTAPSRR